MHSGYLAVGKNIFSGEEVCEHLQKLIADPIFLSARVLSRFLSFIVEETLEGRSEQLKEYSIGISVLNRGRYFNPQTDGIVRVHAARLRRSLTKYYEGAGETEMIRIIVPKGSYIPGFYERDSMEAISNRLDISCLYNRPAENLYQDLKIGVIPFKYFSQSETDRPNATGFTLRLTNELTGIKCLSVIAIYSLGLYSAESLCLKEVFAKTGAQYLLIGDLQYYADRIRVIIQLIDNLSLELVWYQEYDRVVGESNLLEMQDEIVKSVIADVEKFWGTGSISKSKISALTVA